MKFIKYIILSWAAIFTLYSCEGFFETQVELPIPEHTPILAVSCFLDNNSSSIFVDVNRTRGLFEDIPLTSENNVEGAIVELFEDGNLLTTIEYDAAIFKYYKEMSDNFLTVGKTYELRVSHPDFATVSATQIMPEPIPLISTEYRSINNSGFSGYDGEIKVNFDDPAGEENFYEFYAGRITRRKCYDASGELISEETDFANFYFDSEGPESPEAQEGFGYRTLLIEDATFDGQNYTFDTKFYEGGIGFPGECPVGAEEEETEVKIVVYWRTISKDFYRYSTSLKQNQNAEDNPFAEPVSVFTNFDNGVGAFCLRADLEYEVEE